MSHRGSKRKASGELEYKPSRVRKLVSDVKIKDEPDFESPNKIEDSAVDYLDQSMPMDTSELELEEKVDTKPDWVEDNTVPKGWKRRIFDNNAMVHFNIPGLMDPEGSQFRSRQNALRVLIKRKADPDILSELSECLIHEGWDDHELLPDGWKFRKQRKDFHRTRVEFLNHKAEMFKSLKETVEYVENNYDDETQTSFQSLLELSSLEMRVEGYDWRADDSVPPGWQMRVAEGKVNKEFFLSPDGKMFPSRTVAVQHMIKEEFYEEEVKLMRTKLVEHENWQECPGLPPDWLMKDGSNFVLLTSEGDTLESWSSAMEYIKGNSHYTEQHVEQLSKAMEVKSKERRLEGYDWEEDETVPSGWKSRRAQSKTEKQYFLSPQGHSFPTRFVAYQHLVKEGFPAAKIEEMKQFLYYEDWVDHDLLPAKWKFKRSQGRMDIRFITEGGKFLRSFKIARKHITAHYPQALQNFDEFQQQESIRRRTFGYDWTEDDPTVPPGWMVRVTDGRVRRTFLLSPEGVQYQSRRLALVSAVTENKDQELIKQLRSLLQYEGCETNHLLPENWFYQYVSENAYHIIRETGETFESFISALEFMRANNYTEEEISNIETLEQEKSKERRVQLSGWTEDQNMPPGWRSRPKRGQAGKMLFLSPDGVQYHNRLKCLQVMLSEGYSAQHIMMVKDYMRLESWIEHSSLPVGWMVSTIKSTKGLFLTRDGEVLSSVLAAKDYVSVRPDYDESDIEKLSRVLGELNKQRRQFDEDFYSDPSVPENWKLKEIVNKKGRRLSFLLSPDGVQYHSRRLALQSAVSENKDPELIESLRSVLYHEGYEWSELLPENWFYQYVSENSYHIMRENGDTFESFISAQEFMKSNFYSEEEIKNLESFSELKKIEKRQNKEDFYSDPSLPRNWRMKEIATKRSHKRYFYLSPDGQQFANRRQATVHMITHNYSQADVDKMRSSLVLEGFEESDLLPTNWMIRYRPGPPSPSVHILSECGMVFESFSMASEMMRNNPNYSEDDIARLTKYLELKSQSRSEKYSWSSDPKLPQGWKYRVAPGTKQALFFLAPEGKMIHGRLRSCIHLLQSGDVQAAAAFKLLLQEHESWRESQYIPSGWLFKEIRNSSRGGSHYGYLFLTREGNYYEGGRQALDHIKASPSYTLEDEDSFQQLVPACQAQRLKLRDQVKKEEVEIKQEETDGEDVEEEQEMEEEEEQEGEEWAEDETIPTGWRSRMEGNNKVFLSPDGEEFQSRLLALVHLLEVADTVTEVQIMRKGFATEGWSQDGYLPPNWWFKYKSNQASFITSKGTLLQSMKSAAEFIKENEPRYVKKFPKFEKQMKKSH